MENGTNQCNTPQNKFYSKYLGSCTQVDYNMKEKYEKYENQCNTPQNKFSSKYLGACTQVKYNMK